MSFFAFQDIITGTAGFIIVIAVFLALNLEQVVPMSSEAESSRFESAQLTEIISQIAVLKAQVATVQALPNEDAPTLTRIIENLKKSIADLSGEKSAKASNNPTTDPVFDRETYVELQKQITIIGELKKALAEATALAGEQSPSLIALENAVKEAESKLQQSRDRQNVLRLIPEKNDTTKEPILVLVQNQRFQVMRFDTAETQTFTAIAALRTYLKDFAPSGHYVVFYFKPTGAHYFDILTDQVRSAGYEIGYDLVPENIELEMGTTHR